MVYLVIKQPTNDINSWKESFDQFLEYRKIGGEISCKVFQTPKKQNELIVLSEWNSMNDVKEFIDSQSFEMIKEIEKSKPLTIQLLNKQNFGKFIKKLY